MNTSLVISRSNGATRIVRSDTVATKVMQSIVAQQVASDRDAADTREDTLGAERRRGLDALRSDVALIAHLKEQIGVFARANAEVPVVLVRADTAAHAKFASHILVDAMESVDNGAAQEPERSVSFDLGPSALDLVALCEPTSMSADATSHVMVICLHPERERYRSGRAGEDNEDLRLTFEDEEILMIERTDLLASLNMVFGETVVALKKDSAGSVPQVMDVAL
jgi:hypothetical protein